ncbi:MAG: anti-sigma factor, partial [Planctomycetota bacterium]
ESENGRMPERLREHILVDAGKYFESSGSPESMVLRSVAPVSETQSGIGINGWMIGTILSTAACLFLLLSPVEKGNGIQPTVAELQQTFLDSNPVDLKTVELLAGFDANGGGVKNSKLIWSDDQQTGYMNLTGLKVNDPAVEQYQLWIFESADQSHPIDGGVFDITKEDQVVAIDAKIKVDGARYWAITVEKPGGVVVSDRSRIASADPELAALVAAALQKAGDKPE